MTLRSAWPPGQPGCTERFCAKRKKKAGGGGGGRKGKRKGNKQYTANKFLCVVSGWQLTLKLRTGESTEKYLRGAQPQSDVWSHLLTPRLRDHFREGTGETESQRWKSRDQSEERPLNTTGWLHSGTRRLWSPSQDLQKLKPVSILAEPVSILAWSRGGAWVSTLTRSQWHWRLWEEGDSGLFFKAVAPGRSTLLEWMIPHLEM